ncbi:hypothetical protein MMC21_001272 [Puttea exsequens]|nr:hypothetical protein [Puttea exsequens]
MTDIDSSPPNSSLDHVKEVWNRVRADSPIYNFLIPNILLRSATSTGSFVAHLCLEPHHLNSKIILHGSVTTCLMDWAGGMAIAATGLEKTGVSTDLHTTFVSTAKKDDILFIKAKASKVGKNLAFTTMEISRMKGFDGSDENVIVATGTHTKYVR